ncbi:MAG: hypothetical protein ACOX1P_10685 [Thermoguttaceae bacterium]|jgi:hypothetical protein
MQMPIVFPSEVEQLGRRLAAESELSPGERLLAAAAARAAAEAFSLAGDCREQQLEYHEACERQGHERMREFIARHVAVSATVQR